MPERKRGYLREQRLKSIKKRRRLIKGQKYSGRYLGEWIDEPEFKSGILAKGKLTDYYTSNGCGRCACSI